jgi:hypothetical protein
MSERNGGTIETLSVSDLPILGSSELELYSRPFEANIPVGREVVEPSPLASLCRFFVCAGSGDIETQLR